MIENSNDGKIAQWPTDQAESTAADRHADNPRLTDHSPVGGNGAVLLRGTRLLGRSGAVLILVLLLPVLVIALHDRPSADDYAYARLTYHTVLSRGVDPSALVVAAWNTSAHFMQTWQGLYSSAFLLALQPAIFGDRYYAITAPLLLAALTFGLAIVFRTALRVTLSSVAQGWMSPTLLTVFVIVECLPSASEGLFWFNGGVNYTLFWVFTLINIALLVLLWFKRRIGGRVGCVGATTALSFVISGGNHVTALLNLGVLGGAFLLFASRRRLDPMLPLLAAVSGLAISLMAPGTLVRRQMFHDTPGPLEAVLTSMGYTAFFLDKWVGIALFCYLTLMMPLMTRVALSLHEQGMLFRWPLAVAGASYGVLTFMLAIPYFAMRHFGEGRLHNVAFGTFVLLTLANGVWIIGWAVQKFESPPSGVRRWAVDGFRAPTVLCLVLVIGCLGNNRDWSVSVYALRDLINGSARGFSAEFDARVKQYEDPEEDDIAVYEFSNQPALLYRGDVSSDPSHWINVDVAAYYSKSSVRLVPRSGSDD